MIQVNKKGEMFARDWIVGVIILGGIIALSTIMVEDYGTTYDNNITDPEFSDSFNNLDAQTEVAMEMWNKTTGEGGISTVGTFTLLFKATFGVIDLVFDSVVNTGSQMFSFTEYFGIPQKVGFLLFSILFTILSVVIIFIILSSISSRKL